MIRGSSGLSPKHSHGAMTSALFRATPQISSASLQKSKTLA